MSVHPIHQAAATPIYEPSFDLPAETIQNDSHRLEGLAKLMAYHADGSAHVGQTAKPAPPASELPVNELIAEYYVHFVGER